MISIWKRELQAYFYTASGYIYMGVFLALSSIMFYLQILQNRSSDLLTFMGQMSYLWMLLSPVLTMRLLTDEKQKHTDQLLFTSPVSLMGVVLGKFLAALSVMGITVLFTLGYVLVVSIYGQVYPGEMMVGYLGFVLQGCAFVAIDLYVSSLVATPVSAVVISIGINLCLWIMDMLAYNLPEWIGDVLTFFSLYSRNEPFLMGQLSFASVMFDLSVVVIGLVLTIHRLDSRRYQGV